jgi:plastocyanin
MRHITLILIIALTTTLSALAIDQPASTQPSAPSTMPAGVSIRGSIDFQSFLSFQKPDPTRAVLYLDSEPTLDALPPPAKHFVVAQHNRAFVPSFIVIPKGAQVDFPNWDHFYHNVFSRSLAAPAFDLDRYPYGYSKTKTFDKVGVVQLFCNIHPFMRAIVFVTPNTYFTRADAKGEFQLTNVPPGHYTLVAWHDRCDETRQPIEVVAADVTGLTLHLSESRDAIMDNDAPTHHQYFGIDRGLGVKREQLNLPVIPNAQPASEPAPTN